MAITRIANLAEYIADRRRTYDEALAADMRRLAKTHGEAVVREALALVGRRKSASHWDAEGHKRAVASGLQRVLIERSLAEPSELPDLNE